MISLECNRRTAPAMCLFCFYELASPEMAIIPEMGIDKIKALL
jgi:hypothetical protein